MNPFSVDVKDLLVENGLGAFAAPADAEGWGIFISSEPNKPDKTITIYDTGGGKPDGCMDSSKAMLMYPTVQVRVRGKTYLEAYTKILAVDALLDRCGQFTASGPTPDDNDVLYYDIVKQGEESFLKKDENNRYIWVADYRAQRKEVL